MTVVDTVPGPNQSLGETQNVILTNFSDMKTHFAVNHIDYNDAGAGKHPFLQMPDQVAAPTTAANEGGLYTAVADTISNLFWRPENDGTAIQLTGPSILKANPGYTFLPGGLLLQWGNFVAAGGTPGSTAVVFPIAFGAAPYSITCTIRILSNSTHVVYVSTAPLPTAAGFTAVRQNAVNTTVYYMAIGPIS